MDRPTLTDLSPRWASAPGATILRALEARALSTDDLADALAISDPDARRLLVGENPITPQLADGLVKLLGSTSSFWLAREQQYRESLSWLAVDALVQQSPLASMVRDGWVDHAAGWKDQARELLEFYDVPDADNWRTVWGPRLAKTHYRTSAAFESEDLSVAAWLRRVETECEQLEVAEWSAGKLLALLPHLRSLTRQRDPRIFLPQLQLLLATAGVAIVLVPALDGNRLSGAASVLPNGRRIIGLTARHRADDHLWFTVFHELGHLVLHGAETDFLDDFDGQDNDSVLEEEANEFARTALIPQGIQALANLRAKGPTAREVLAFASSVGVAPGVVVGRLQHDGVLRYNQLRRLIRNYQWDGSTLKT